jgi:hypothetical protein
MDQPLPQESERIRALEQRLLELNERVAALEAPQPKRRDPRVHAALSRRRASRWAFLGEQWTGRAGLALLFLGLVFLFRYSIEQGWITPAVRVLFGAGLGSLLLWLGLRLSTRRPSYGALLLAGAVSVFYATGWAGSYLYSLVDRPIAFLWMGGVTLLALQLARRHAQPALASLGAMGGFATPFLLGSRSEPVLEVVAYTSLVVLWAAALYLTRGWRSVLWTYLGGGVGVLAIAGGLAEQGADRWLVQAGLLLTWSLAVALPFLREAARAEAGGLRAHPLIPVGIEIRALGALGTAAALTVTARLWSLADPRTGSLYVLAAALFAAFAWWRTRSPNIVGRSAAPVTAALCATGTFLLLPEGPGRWAAITTQAILYLAAGERERFRGVEWVGHGLFVLFGLALVREGAVGVSPAFSTLSWSFLWGLVVAAGAAARFVRPPGAATAYLVTAHVLALLWLADQFAGLSEASEWVTVAWGLYGALLLLAGLELGRRLPGYFLGLQGIAGATLGLTVLKLLIVDMAQVSAPVRIGLFLGAGATLLLLSYLFQRTGDVRRFAGSRPES